MARKIISRYRHTLHDSRIALLLSVLLLGSSPVLSEPGLSTKVDSLSARIFSRQLQQAQAGDAVAQLATAQRLESGKGAGQDMPKAFFWYNKAAEQGLPEAQYKVATMLETGVGTEKNLAQAQQWYKESAKQHYALAVARLARLEKTEREAKEKAEEKIRVQAEQQQKHKAAQEARAQAAREAKRKAEQETQLRIKQARQSRINQAHVPSSPEQQPGKQKQYAEAGLAGTVIATRPGPQETLELLLPGNWLNNNAEVDFLPSSLSSCVRQGMQLSCFSHEREIRSAQYKLRYMTQSTIKATAPGAIIITYRYQVTRVRDNDNDNDNSLTIHSGPNHPLPKKGWQNAFVYQCQMADNNTFECQDDKKSNMTLTRNTATVSARQGSAYR